VQRVPVDEVEIVGSDLHLVEHVTGRLTTARAAMAGAGNGAWFGLFVGLLVVLFTTGPAWLGLVLGGAAIGAAGGCPLRLFRTGRRTDSVTSLGAGTGRRALRRPPSRMPTSSAPER
jgi:hypothetical protein